MKGQRPKSQRDYIRSNKHLERHFLTYLRNACTYVNETCPSYSLPSSHDTDDSLKVMGSKVKVTDNIFQKCISGVEDHPVYTLTLQS